MAGCRFAIGTALLCFGAVAATAALPPKYQRLREFEAILASNEVTSAFPDNELITSIEYVRSDLYRVRSAKCRMEVTLSDLPLPEGMVGSRRFAVNPGRVICAPVLR